MTNNELMMYDLAKAFMNTGEINFIEGKIKNRSKYQNVAGFVNLAFACELFLKLLLCNDSYNQRKHELVDLWDVLNPNHTDIAKEIKDGVMKSLVSDMTFDQMLQNDNNVFKDYRYLYEPGKAEIIKNNPLKPQFLRCFCFQLHDICIRYYPDINKK